MDTGISLEIERNGGGRNVLHREGFVQVWIQDKALRIS
jgi:hypothetical protein